ncbi:hypothetical protein RSAG8_09898, partial [Rhizoctonia solani AG-8 WAC10335]
MVDREQEHERVLNVPHNYKLRSILQDQTNPLSDDPAPHLSQAAFFPWTKASIRTLWGGGRATRMPWRGGSEDQPPEERWERVVKRWKDCMAVCAGNQLRLVHTRGNKLREVAALTIHEDEKLGTATWALEFDTLHPLVCVAGDTGIIHVFDVESWEMVGALTGHGGNNSFNDPPNTARLHPLYFKRSDGANVVADRAIKIWRVPDFPTPETRPERGVNYHIIERPLFSCTHLHETGIEYVAWLKGDVLVSVSSNYARVKVTDEATDSDEEEDLSRLDISGTIVVWQWLDLNRFAPEGLDIKEPLVKPSHWDWTESRSYLTLCKIFLFDEEDYLIHTSWSLTSIFGSPLFMLTNQGNKVHIIDIQRYNESPEEVKSRMRDPEKSATRRGGVRREVQHGKRAELRDVPRAQLYAGNSRYSYGILGAVQNPHSPGVIVGLGKDGLLMLWRDEGLRPGSQGIGLGGA